MAHRIEIIQKAQDTRAQVSQKKFQSLIKGKIKNVLIVDTYTIDKTFVKGQLQEIAASLSNPIVEETLINRAHTPHAFDYVIEIGYLPGVTDNVGSTAREIIEDLLKTKFKDQEKVYTSKKYFISGDLSQQDIENIAQSLYNPLIQRAYLADKKEFTKIKNEVIVPRVVLDEKKELVGEVDLHVPDQELEEIGLYGIKNPDGTHRGPLALPLFYLKAIKEHFEKLGRKPTDIELETLAQTWSEHCKHTIFADPIDDVREGLFKRYIRGATEKINKDFCISVFTDNSGVIEFDEEYAISHKVETHNSPSALDPFGGAVTGIVGVNRDALGTGLGARPIINFYGFCLARPDDPSVLYRDRALKNPMLSARRIMDGVIDGVNYGGNCSGIPTPQGFLYFHPRYRGKPLVFGGTVGLIPRKIEGKPTHIKKANPGDYIVMIGGKVGLDGIHGATFSSVGLDTGSPATAVQIGDPITQKKFSDAVVRDIRDLGLYTSITDCGAGGLSSAVGEMAKQSGGCEVNLEKVPLKYPGLAPWQTWISESQERMILSVPPKNWKKFAVILKKRGVEATAIGTFTKEKKCIVKYEGKTIMDLGMDFLHDGLPKRPMKTKKPTRLVSNFFDSVGSRFTTSKSQKNSYLRSLLYLLKDYNFTSFEFIPNQYDHEVQGGSVLKPLQGKGRVIGDTSVVRPVLSSRKGVILSQALYPELSEVDPYQMAAVTIDTAIRQVVAAGGSIDHLALLDNFCWCSSDEPERLWQLKEAARGCYDFAVSYGTPYISGKDSMFNDFKGYDKKGDAIKISVPPTLLISAIGVIDDVSKVVSLDLKFPGDLIYILGKTTGKKEQEIEVNTEENIKLYRTLSKAIGENLVASSQSIGRGGLALALAKCAIGGSIGVEVSFPESMLFAEEQGRILVSINPKNQKKFEDMLVGNTIKLLGKVRTDKKFIVKDSIQTTVGELEKSYKSTFRNY